MGEPILTPGRLTVAGMAIAASEIKWGLIGKTYRGASQLYHAMIGMPSQALNFDNPPQPFDVSGFPSIPDPAPNGGLDQTLTGFGDMAHNFNPEQMLANIASGVGLEPQQLPYALGGLTVILGLLGLRAMRRGASRYQDFR